MMTFVGTIRDNIDPVGTHTDTEVWLALEQARMKDHVQSMVRYFRTKKAIT